MSVNLYFNLSLYKDKVIKITLEKNKKIPYVYGNLIALLKYDEGMKTYIFSHPYNTKTKEILAGLSAFDPIDIKSISEVNQDELVEWYSKYYAFHKSIIKEKGYDICEVDIKDLEISLKIEAK